MKCYETFGSRQGDSSQLTLTFIVDEVNDDQQALGHLFAVAPAKYRGLTRTGSKIKQEQLGYQTWRFEVPYTPVDPAEEENNGGDPTTPFGIIDFDTTGATQHITQCIEQADYGAEAAAPNIRLSRVIGLTKDGVEGVDIVIPQMRFTATKTYEPANITSQFILDLMNLTGKTNSQPFTMRTLLFAAGELLFLGATGQSKGRKDWEITYQFSAIPNRRNIVISPQILVTSKRGHDYLWVMYNIDEKDDKFVQTPSVAFVSKVYEEADFGPVLGVL